MQTYGFVLAAAMLIQSSAAAQDSTLQRATEGRQRANADWFSRRDATRAGLASVGVGVLSLVDESVAKALQKPSLHSSPTLQRSANVIQTAGDPGALIISVSLYVIGAVSHHTGLADASLHSTESIAVGGAITQLLKLGVGRARPNLTHDDNAYVFHPLHGYQTDMNSFPSGHTSASFAAATVFSREIRRRHPGASNVTTPLLYATATLVGLARMYNDRHWLSDVAGGALIGHFVGGRITGHAHSGK